jgi:hypothetical protein
MKVKKKFFLIEIPLYHIDIAISIAQSQKEFEKSISSVWDIDPIYVNNNLPDGALAVTSSYLRGGKLIPYAIRFEKHPFNTEEGHVTIAHEIFHVVFGILHTRGLTLSYDSEEAFAYLTGHLTREIYKNL